jgi:hypothetical protein
MRERRLLKATCGGTAGATRPKSALAPSRNWRRVGSGPRTRFGRREIGRRSALSTAGSEKATTRPTICPIRQPATARSSALRRRILSPARALRSQRTSSRGARLRAGCRTTDDPRRQAGDRFARRRPLFQLPADQRIYAGGGGSIRPYGWQMAGSLAPNHDRSPGNRAWCSTWRPASRLPKLSHRPVCRCR